MIELTDHRLLEVRRDAYVDSVGLLNVSQEMQDVSDVTWANALMGTPANLELLQDAGFDADEVSGLGANDLVLAVVAESEDAARQALDVATESMRGGGGGGPEEAPEAAPAPRSLEEAAATLGDANIAVVSVPGQYAALEAHKALTAGLHVLLFSDHVPLADEAALKQRAAEHGLLVMGAGAGTAMLGGAGLGFANAVRRGPVRVVAAAGTGAQEAMTLLHRWGSGVSDVIGVGGRDLSREVGATSTRLAVAAEGGGGDGEEVVLLVSKPPDADVAETVLGELAGTRAVCAFIGLDRALPAPDGVRVASTLDQAVLETLDVLGAEVPDPGAGLRSLAASAAEGLDADRRAVRGLFSGGTLCYEAMVVLARRLGPVHSNTPLREDWGLPAPEGAHVCLDLGEEEYTENRPHPMIDLSTRAEELERAVGDPTTAVVLVDVVLGYGAHPDPAGGLVEILGGLGARDGGPAVVAYVLGTDDDPQVAADQRTKLEDAGCVLAPTGARSALLAAAIADRRPELAEETP